MKTEQQRLIVGLIIGLIIGLIVGVFVDQVYPGTAVDDNKEKDAATDVKTLQYYLVTLPDVETWLSAWLDTAYPAEAEKPDLSAYMQAISQVAAEDRNYLKSVEDTGNQMQDVLLWSHAALLGLNSIDPGSPVADQLPKDRTITACLALDADPWTIDPNYVAGVKLYLVVPVGEEKNVPKDWTPVTPKNEFDIGWTPLLCDPDPNADK
jgi:hypothetical protein